MLVSDLLLSESSPLNSFGVIYKIANKETGECYIGQTTRPLKDRVRDHKRQKACVRLCRAFEKYGDSFFTIEVLCQAETREELNSKEIEFITKENSLSPNGYNLIAGPMGCEMSAEMKNKISQTMRKIKGRVVIQENPDTGEIIRFEALADAKKLGFDGRKISYCCSPKSDRTQYAGYIWYYEGQKKTSKKNIPIEALDKEGTVVYYFPTFSSARAKGFIQECVRRSINFGTPYKNLYWRKYGCPNPC